MSEMAEINAPARTANNLRIVFSGEDESHWLAFTGTMTSGRRTVKHGPHNGRRTPRKRSIQ
jgi:hypothetical protein